MMVWAIMVGSVFFYGGVAFLVAGGMNGAGVWAGNPGVPVWLFPLLAFVAAWAAVLVRQRLAEASPPRNPSAQEQAALFQRSIVVWAVDESVAVLGLVAVFLGSPATHFVAYGVVSLLLLFWHRPVFSMAR